MRRASLTRRLSERTKLPSNAQLRRPPQREAPFRLEMVRGLDAA